MSWSPISERELAGMIVTAEEKMAAETSRFWEAIRLPKPEKWQLHPWGDQGGGFWVVAIAGKRCVYYNDIEEGFELSPFAQWGAIGDYICNNDELHELLMHIWLSGPGNIVKLRGPEPID